MIKDDDYIFYFKNGKLCRFKINNRKAKGLKANDRNINSRKTTQEPKYIRTIDMQNESAIIKIMESFEIRNSSEPIEHALVILKNGNVYECVGSETGVMVDTIFGKNLKGAYISHNHPIKETGYTFSDEDVNLFKLYDINVLRGVDEKYVYQLTRNSKEIDEMGDWQTEETFLHNIMIVKAKQYGIGYRRWKNDKRTS